MFPFLPVLRRTTMFISNEMCNKTVDTNLRRDLQLVLRFCGRDEGCRRIVGALLFLLDKADRYGWRNVCRNVGLKSVI